MADAVPLFGFDLSSGLQLIVEQSFGAAAAAPAAAQFMNVTVPPGVSSGQTVCVQTPAGMSVTAVVPAGVGAGQSRTSAGVGAGAGLMPLRRPIKKD